MEDCKLRREEKLKKLQEELNHEKGLHRKREKADPKVVQNFMNRWNSHVVMLYE